MYSVAAGRQRGPGARSGAGQGQRERSQRAFIGKRDRFWRRGRLQKGDATHPRRGPHVTKDADYVLAGVEVDDRRALFTRHRRAGVSVPLAIEAAQRPERVAQFVDAVAAGWRAKGYLGRRWRAQQEGAEVAGVGKVLVVGRRRFVADSKRRAECGGGQREGAAECLSRVEVDPCRTGGDVVAAAGVAFAQAHDGGDTPAGRGGGPDGIDAGG